MAIVYDTILAPHPSAALDLDDFIAALHILLGGELVRRPAALLAGPSPDVPMFVDYRVEAGPLTDGANQVVLVTDDLDALEAAVRARHSAGDNIIVWFQAFNWERDRVAADLETDEDEASLESTVAAYLVPVAADPGISSPYYGTDFKPYFGAITQYLETRGTRAPIDDELLLSIVAEALTPIWGPLRAGTSMVSVGMAVEV